MENSPSQQQHTPTKNASEDVDLGQMIQAVISVFKAIGDALLRLFLYIKKNIFILIGLGILGLAAGFGVQQITSEKMKTEIIVRPNIESKDYLYDVIEEIQANIEAENQAFFEPLDIDIKKLEGFEVTVESLGDKNSKLEDELKYLELLKGWDISGTVSDVVRSEILSRNSLNHKITFYYKEGSLGHESAEKLMEYINSNPYFNELITVHLNNARDRIVQNDSVIKQLDGLIAQYATNLAMEKQQPSDTRIILENEEQLNIRELFDLKNILIRDTEAKRIELKTRANAIKVINFGKSQEVIKPLLGRAMILFPTIFIGAFVLISIVKYLDKKSSELLSA